MPGLVVVDIDPSGQAARLGIRVHDVLFKCNGSVLDSVGDLSAKANVSPENELLVIRGREVLTLTAKVGALGVTLVPYPIPDTAIPGVDEVLRRFKDDLDANYEAEKKAKEQANLDEWLRRVSSIKTTTAHHLEGHRVLDTLEIITAEYVGGVNVIREFFAGITDAIGGRSGSLQNELREARESCLVNLKAEADRLGANAVIGVDLDYSEISGGGKSMLFLVASGTAVVVEKI